MTANNNVIREDYLYRDLQKSKLEEWEALCLHCGACCGSIEGDLCENLIKLSENKYFCRVYGNRFGEHHTISGKKMNCVPIRDILYKSWPGDTNCAYKKYIRNRQNF